MVPANPTLFFQIAAGLIPLLLAATSLNDVVKPGELLDNVPKPARLGLRLAIVLFVAAAVIAEFLAISEAVAARNIEWPVTRTVFVATVIVVEALVLATGLVLPWVGGWFVAFAFPAALAACVWFAVGSLLDSVSTASNRYDTASYYCLSKANADQQRATSEVDEKLNELALREAALRVRIAREPNTQKKAALVLQRDALAYLKGEYSDYRRALFRLLDVSAPERLKTIEDISALLGC